MRLLLYTDEHRLYYYKDFTHKMATTQQQIFNPTFSNPDDMPEYVSMYDKPKRRAMTKEEKAQKNRDNYKRWYNENWQ